MIYCQCFSDTHTRSFKEITFTHVDSHTCLQISQNRSHKHVRLSNSPPMTVVQSPPSCTFQAHALTPPWLCWPLTWGEGACCLMVWIHSPCVKSFPASVTLRGKWGWWGGGRQGGCPGCILAVRTLGYLTVIRTKYSEQKMNGYKTRLTKDGQNQDSRFWCVRVQSGNKGMVNSVMIKSSLSFFSVGICHWRNSHLYTFCTHHCRTDAINRGPERHILTNMGLHTMEPNVLCLWCVSE